MKNLDITKNKLFQKILAEELTKQVKLYESSEVNIWKTMAEKARELALLSLDPKYGDDLAEEYTSSDWNNIPSEVQEMLSKVLDQFTFKLDDVNNTYLKANIVRLFMKYEDKLANIEVNGSPLKYTINTIKDGRPSVWALNAVVAELIAIHAVNGFKDPELTRKPKEQVFKSNNSDGSNITGPRGFSKPDWRGAYKGD